MLGDYILGIRYADDIVLMVEKERKLKETRDKIVKEKEKKRQTVWLVAKEITQGVCCILGDFKLKHLPKLKSGWV